MLPRGLLLRNPALRSALVCGLYRYLLKAIGAYGDRVVRGNLGLMVRMEFRGSRGECVYQRYSPRVRQAELLGSYLKAVEGDSRSSYSERL